MALRQRLTDMGVDVQSSLKDAVGVGYWLSVAPQSQRLLGDAQLQNLSNEFNELKHKIMLCEGLHLLNSLHRMAPAPQRRPKRGFKVRRCQRS